MSYQPIENYGVIGDLRTVALVGMDGSIDFYCCPEFDSPSVFASLLDDEKGGSFRIAPACDSGRPRQLYLPETNVLLTRFLFEDGVAEVSDFMPIGGAGDSQRIVRRAKTVRGEVRYCMICKPRFDYARSDHEIEQNGQEIVFASKVTLRHGETASFVLEHVDSNAESPAAGASYVSDSFKETSNFWRRWARRSRYQGRWRETVHRSALTLKLLTSARHGSIVAAPTFALPEDLGGVRNWDYRYTWIRDASFTLYGLIRLGYTDEAAAFMHWIEARCNELEPDGSLQIMYAIDGHHELTEQELSHLEGYRKSAPVRIGNGAYDQLQLDIYGELMDSVYLYNKYGAPISYDLWRNLVRLIDWVIKNWRRKDDGIWEVRGGSQEFLYSRLMCWVAIDRGVRLALKRSFPAPLDRWLRSRDEIYREIMTEFWDPELRAFVQYKGSKSMDAANLLMPMVKFLGPTDPRWLSTLAAIERELVDDSLVYRYRIGNAAGDGLTGEEGTFSMCSFWYVECLARAGDLDKARFLFEKTLGYANHLGLYSEQLGLRGEFLGNFPQAFTHLGLISAAYFLDRQLSAAPRVR